VTSVTAFFVRLCGQSDSVGIAAAKRRKNAAHAVRRGSAAKMMKTSPEGAKENAAYVGKYPIAFDFFDSGPTAFDQNRIPR
jgi:hypothetical protein